jgi:hypothetical protein
MRRGSPFSTICSVVNRYCSGFVFCVRSDAVQINDWRGEQSKATNQKCVTLCVSFSPPYSERDLEKRVDDEVYAFCIAGTCIGRRACDERNADLECCNFSQVGVNGKRVWGFGCSGR